MRNLRALIFSVLFIQLSCNQHESSEYIQKLDNPELFQSAMQNLTDIVVYDIFSPPVASRVYLYPTIAAYEIIAAHQDKSFNSLAGQVKDLNEIPKSDNKAIIPNLAALFSFNSVGKKHENLNLARLQLSLLHFHLNIKWSLVMRPYSLQMVHPQNHSLRQTLYVYYQRQK